VIFDLLHFIVCSLQHMDPELCAKALKDSGSKAKLLLEATGTNHDRLARAGHHNE
jgi:hypothetical protein